VVPVALTARPDPRGALRGPTKRPATDPVPSSLLILLNPGSGSSDPDALPRTLLELAERAQVPARVEVLLEPARLPALVDEAIAQGVTTIVAGGGDGTVSSVASCLMGRDVRLGVLPLGTLNHFAKDLGLPLEAEAAMAVVLAGHVRRVDVGEVNGRVFLNNSSIGLYPRMVRLRQRRDARGWRKWLVAARAMFAVMRHRRDLGVRLELDGTSIARRTPLVFIGNNEYRMEGLDPGSRPSLTEGVLSLYVLRARGWSGLLRAAWQVASGSARSGDATDTFRVQEARIDLRHDHVEVALDGEVTPMTTPLVYRVRKLALEVLVPPAA
jgi:diacylglycerol kinase family enzyme